MALCVVIVGVVWRPVVGPNVGFDSPSRAKTGHVSIAAKVEAIDISVEPIVRLSLKDGIKVFPSKRTGEVTRADESFIWRNRDNRFYWNRTPISRVWWQIGNQLAANEYLGDKCRCSAIISESNDHIWPIWRGMIFRNWANRIESFKEQSGPFAADESFRAGLCGIRRDLGSIGAFFRCFGGLLGCFDALSQATRLPATDRDQGGSKENQKSIEPGLETIQPILCRLVLALFCIPIGILIQDRGWRRYDMGRRKRGWFIVCCGLIVCFAGLAIFRGWPQIAWRGVSRWA